jgi:hypothetical protein
MNAMSALYHIAQRDPPALGNTRPWYVAWKAEYYNRKEHINQNVLPQYRKV